MFPERDLQPGDRRDRDALAPPFAVAVVHRLPQRDLLARLAPDEQRRVDGLDQRAVRLGRSEALAPAGDTLVGDDLDQAAGADVPEPLRHPERLVQALDHDVGDDVGDLHAGLFSVRREAQVVATVSTGAGSARPMGVRVMVNAAVVPSRRKTPATMNAAV